MAVRTDEDTVAAIIAIDSDDGGDDLTQFILAANLLVTEVTADAGYDTERLKVIETWLAAHFYTVRDPRNETEGAGGVKHKVEGKTDMGLNSSKYGQMVLRLDTAGGFAALEQKALKGAVTAAGVTWLGTEEDETDTGA